MIAPKLFADPAVSIGPNQEFKGKTSNNIPWSIFCGDALTTVAKLSDESFGCCVTSPPYFWLRNYGVDDQIGQEDTVAEYVDSIAGVMDEVFKKLKKDGLLFLNLGDTYYSGKGESKGTDRKSNKRRFGLRAVDKSGGLDIGCILRPHKSPLRAAEFQRGRLPRATQAFCALRSSVIILLPAMRAIKNFLLLILGPQSPQTEHS